MVVTLVYLENVVGISMKTPPVMYSSAMSILLALEERPIQHKCTKYDITSMTLYHFFNDFLTS